MQTIKIIDKETYATEQHDLEHSKIRKINILGKEFDILDPCNINLFVTNECKNNCFFCHSHGTDVQNDNNYLTWISELLQQLGNEYFEITLTGGEPTLSPLRFVETLRILKQYHMRVRTFCTTGEGLFSLYEGKELCQHLIENGFTNNISVSRIHYEDSQNLHVLKYSLLNKELSKLMYFFNLNNAALRISCNLMNSYINSLNEILHFVDFYQDMGISHIIFRELVGVEEVKIKQIVSEMRRNRAFTQIETLHGLLYDVEIFDYKNKIVKCYHNNSVPRNLLTSITLKDGLVLKGMNDEVLSNDKSWK